MVNEAIIVELLGNKGNPVRYNCADATLIPKGSIMQITAERTALISDGNTNAFAGIAAHEKVALDGSTTISCYTCGIFLMNDGEEEPTIGSRVRINGVNVIKSASAPNLLKSCVGIELNNGTSGVTDHAVLIGSGL